MEHWANVEQYEGLYVISDHGRVKNVVTGKVLSPVNNGKGYYKVELFKDRIGKRLYIHRMVAEAFLPRSNKKEVNHKDGNPSNNCVTNLEWVSSSENSKHAVYTGALKAWGNKAKPIEAISISDGTVIKFATISEAERCLKTKHITTVLKGKRHQAKGYTFRYIEGGDACANFEYIST